MHRKYTNYYILLICHLCNLVHLRPRRAPRLQIGRIAHFKLDLGVVPHHALNFIQMLLHPELAQGAGDGIKVVAHSGSGGCEAP